MRVTEPAWRSHLLGSLTGQLQLATFAVVFTGLTTVSSLSLWLNHRNTMEQHHSEMIARAKEFDACIGLPHSSSAQDLLSCLNRYSGLNYVLWLEQANGNIITPDLDQPVITQQIIRDGMQSNATRLIHKTNVVKVNGRDFLTHLHQRYPNGMRLWTSEEITTNNTRATSYLTWMILIWGVSLILMMVAVARVVRRITSPLYQLNAELQKMSAKSLKNERVRLKNAPQEIRQLADSYNNLLDRLSSSWSQQRQFVSGVSHELRNPLMIASGYLNRVLRQGSNLTEAQREQLQTAEEEVQRINRLISDLLDLSRSDSGRLAIQSDPLDLLPLLQGIIAMAQESSDRPITLTSSEPISTHGIHIGANADRLRQVLLNLIENAEKYSPAGSPISMQLSQADGWALIEVCDQGIGIPAGERHRVFERFYRGTNASNQVGSGLGLSVVRVLVEGMGGSIDVSSNPGQGSCFVMQFPIVDIDNSTDTFES